MTVSPLVDVAWLKAHLHDGDVAIVDTRWYLMDPSQGAAEYAVSHISGAVHLAIDEDLSSPAWDGPGRHPLPPAAKFIATIGNAGIDGDTHVVIYDSAGGSIATRLWWLLRYYGHTRVSLLDGGWQAWQAANGNVAVALASIHDRPLQLRLPIDVDAYGLPSRCAVYRIDETGRHPQGTFDSGDPVLPLDLAARAICLIEFCGDAGK
jgi:thiosulfate/3-mercaptopyruvate sulfurtransferase